MRPLALLSMLLGLFTVVTGIVIATGGTSFASEMLPMLLALVGGVVLVILGLRLQTGWRPGIVLTTVVAGIIGGYFGYQWIAESATIYPSGIQTILAGLAVVLALVVSVQPKERKREF